MKLLEVTIKNFMPYRGEHKLTFPNSTQQNVMLVFGNNMRGKTSFLNTIRWCFYGKALGRHLKEISAFDIVNTDAGHEGDWNVAVYVRFENDGHEYDLRRTMCKKSLVHTPKNSNDLDQNVMMRKNGSVVMADKILHEINQIIPEDIARFFLFDGELLQEYEMLLDDKDEGGQLIKESIEKILGVPALINARNEIDNLLGKARKTNAKETQHISGLEQHSHQLQKLQSERTTLDWDFAELQKRFGAQQMEIDDLEQELEKSRAVHLGKDKYDANKAELKQREERQEKLEEEKLSLLRDGWKDLIQPRMLAHLAKLEQKRNTYTQDQRRRYSIEDRIKNIEIIISQSNCPTCEQEISNVKRDTLGTEIEKLQGELSTIEGDLREFATLSEQISKLSRIKSSGAGDRIPRIDQELREISLRITEVDNENEDLDAQLSKHDTADMAKKRVKLYSLIKDMGNLERDIKDRKTAIEENERKQEQLAKLIESNAVARAQRSTKVVHAYTQLKEIFANSIGELRDQLRTSVAERATEAFKKLTTEPTYRGLKINQNYGLTIVDRDNRDVPQRSAGAEQIVALALIDGLNKSARKTGPIIMDTPLGRLDLNHRENVLKYLPEMAEQVIILVHEGEIRKDEIVESLRSRIGGLYNIERISSSESRIVRE